MKIKVRQNIFETNSSSMHSMVVASSDEFEKFKSGKLNINFNTESFTIEKPDNNYIFNYEQFIHHFDDDKEYDMTFDDAFPPPGTIEKNLIGNYYIHYKS